MEKREREIRIPTYFTYVVFAVTSALLCVAGALVQKKPKKKPKKKISEVIKEVREKRKEEKES